MNYVSDMTPEIETSLIQAQNCLLLLLPDPDNFDILGGISPDSQQHEEKHPLSCVSTNVEECTTVTASTDKNQTDCVSVKHSENCNLNKKGQDPSNPGTDNAPQRDEQHTSVRNEEVCDAKKIEIDENEELSTDETDDEMTAEDDDVDEEQPADQSSEKSKYSREDRDEMMRDHGICSQEFSLTINMFPEHVQIEETPDNADVLQTLKDCLCLIDAKYLPTVQNWLEVRERERERAIVNLTP